MDSGKAIEEPEEPGEMCCHHPSPRGAGAEHACQAQGESGQKEGVWGLQFRTECLGQPHEKAELEQSPEGRRK